MIRKEGELQAARAEIQMCAALETIGNESAITLLEELLRSGRDMGPDGTAIIVGTITRIMTRSAHSPLQSICRGDNPIQAWTGHMVFFDFGDRGLSQQPPVVLRDAET